MHLQQQSNTNWAILTTNITTEQYRWPNVANFHIIEKESCNINSTQASSTEKNIWNVCSNGTDNEDQIAE